MQISSPCHENFSKMSKQGDGRYCGSCEKVVVDLTKMDQQQLINYFEKHKNENICGRVKNFQMGKQNAFENFLFRSRQFISTHVNVTPFRIALLGAISGLMTFTTSCMGKVMYDAPAGKNEKAANDTVKTTKEPAKK